MSFRKICAILLCLASSMMAADTPRPSPDFAINMNDGSQIHLETGAGYPLSRVRLGWSL